MSMAFSCGLLSFLAIWLRVRAQEVRKTVQLRSHHAHHWASFLELESRRVEGTTAARSESLRSLYRAIHNNTHAIEYSGDIQLGGQVFTVLFDTGSDRVIVPSSDCVSDACQKHRLYDASKSKTAANISDPNPCEVSFGAGHVVGYEAEDRVCLGDACAQMGFVQALEESDQPFLDANFDGVVGLSLALRSDASRKSSFLDSLGDSGAIPSFQFSVYMARDLWSDASEISFGLPDPSRFTGPVSWAKLSEPGYWQFSLSDITVGNQRFDICGRGNGSSAPRLQDQNVSSFFGKMCCRSLEEFQHEDRCQYNRSYTGWRSRTMNSGVVLAEYADSRVAVLMVDGCVQKIPREWVSLPNGCRGDGTIQAVLDTGSSLMMGPRPVVDQVLAAVGVKENCSSQDRANLPKVSFTLQDDKKVLTLNPEDYMDTVALSDGVFCWPHFLASPEMGKGAALILGMPFLRAFYTTFDAKGERVGFARAVQPDDKAKPKLRASLRNVALHGRRPQTFDDNLVAALRQEHWTG
jgi:hypothetical protein